VAKVLVVTWDGGGNVDPTIAIAQRLLDDGGAVTAVGPPSLVARFAATGVALTPRDPDGEWDQVAMARDVAAALARDRPDLALVDFMMPGALCATEAAGVATAVLVHTLYGRVGIHEAASPMAMATTVDGVNGLRADLGLAPIDRLAQLLDGADVVLVTSPPSLDTVPAPLAPNVRYVGPVFERVDVERAAEEGLPRVIVSLGTTDMGEREVLERVLAALADEPVSVLATVGDHIDPTAVAAPPNASVRARIPHVAVVPGAAVVVCHGGLGTVLAALRNGVPVLCIPLGRDQHANAAAVVAASAGRSLDRDAAADEIRAAVAALTADGPERAGAARMAAAVAEPAGRHPAVSALLDALR
jgi:UDP:flavonoid glycosyltransferase YjiC (YdhE family)